MQEFKIVYVGNPNSPRYGNNLYLKNKRGGWILKATQRPRLTKQDEKNFQIFIRRLESKLGKPILKFSNQFTITND